MSDNLDNVINFTLWALSFFLGCLEVVILEFVLQVKSIDSPIESGSHRSDMLCEHTGLLLGRTRLSWFPALLFWRHLGIFWLSLCLLSRLSHWLVGPCLLPSGLLSRLSPCLFEPLTLTLLNDCSLLRFLKL